MLETLLLATQPEVPAPGKWTKLGSVLSFLLLGFNCCHALGPVFEASVEAMHLVQRKTVDKKEDEDLDPALSSNIYWSKVNGKRAKNALTLTGSPSVRFHVLSLAVAQEVTRFLTNWHLKANSRQNHASLEAPPLLDVVNPLFSPYILALQYLTSLLRDAGGRVLLVCPAYSSVLDWEGCESSDVRVFRRVIMHVSGWIYRRHITFAEAPPFSTRVPRNIELALCC